MIRIQIKYFLVGLFLTLALASQSTAQSLRTRQPDASETAALKAKESGLIDLEALARAEERAEALREKLFGLQMQELDLQSAIEDIEFRMRPESIQRALAFVGSVRPMDELRDSLRSRLQDEKDRVEKRLELLVSKRERLEDAISRADAEVERMRQQLYPL